MQHISDGGRHVTLNTIISKDTDGERMDKVGYFVLLIVVVVYTQVWFAYFEV